MSSRAPTNLAAMARGILRWAETQGIEERHLLGASQLDSAALEGADARIPYQAHTALWREIGLVLSDPDFGLRSSEAILSASSLGVVGLLAMTSSTVGESIARSVRYGRILKEEVVARSYVTDRLLVVELLPKEAQPRAMAEVSLAAFHHFMERWTGEQIEIRQVFFQHEAPADRSYYERVFPCPVRFGHPTNAIVFDRAIAEIPLRTAQPEVARYLDDQASAKLRQLEAESALGPDLTGRITAAVRLAAEGGDVGIEGVARTLGLSTRTLQRELAARGLNYRRLVDEARFAIAGPLVTTTDLPLEQVAERLGYADAKAFRRAFRRWCGQTPVELRRQKR